VTGVQTCALPISILLTNMIPHLLSLDLQSIIPYFSKKEAIFYYLDDSIKQCRRKRDVRKKEDKGVTLSLEIYDMGEIYIHSMNIYIKFYTSFILLVKMIMNRFI